MAVPLYATPGRVNPALPPTVSCRYLSFTQRDEIAICTPCRLVKEVASEKLAAQGVTLSKALYEHFTLNLRPHDTHAVEVVAHHVPGLNCRRLGCSVTWGNLRVGLRRDERGPHRARQNAARRKPSPSAGANGSSNSLAAYQLAHAAVHSGRRR